MSELNNKEKENIVDPNLKKKGGAGLLIFFIILYMLIAAFVTFYNIRTNDYYQMGLIDYFKKHGTIPQFDILFNKPDEATNNAIAINTNSTNTNAEQVIERTNPDERFFNNNIEIEEIEDFYGSQVKLDKFDDLYHQGDVQYIKISGLKDKDVEEKINTAIKNKVLEKVYNYLDDESILRFNISTHTTGNFANLLSVNIDTSLTYPELDEYGYNKYEYDNVYLNFRLDTGDTFKLKDVFTSDASIRNMLSNTIYKTFAWDYIDDGGWGDMDETDYSDIESKTFLALSGLSQEDIENLPFYINGSGVTIIIKDHWFNIEFLENQKFINIYNLAKTKESIYEGGDLEKRDFVFTGPILNDVDMYEKLDKNIFLVLSKYSFDDEDEFTPDNDTTIDEYISSTVLPYLKKHSKSNKGYIYSIEVNHNRNYGEERMNLNGYALEMDLKDFNDDTIDSIMYEMVTGPDEGVREIPLVRLVYMDKLPEGMKVYILTEYDYAQDGTAELKDGLYWIEEVKEDTEEIVEEDAPNGA